MTMALLGLPQFVREDLSAGNLAVVVSNGRDECNAYGLRHEVAHFYGADEQRVQDLGL